MKRKERTRETELSVRECGDVFQQATANARGLGAKMGEAAASAMGNRAGEFFTPTINAPGDSPFAVLNEGEPDFAVGVHIGKFMAGGQGAGTTVNMYVWDTGDWRKVELFSPYQTFQGGRSSRVIGKFVDAFRKSDPGVSITS